MPASVSAKAAGIGVFLLKSVNAVPGSTGLSPEMPLFFANGELKL